MALPSQLPRSSRAVNFRAYPDRRRGRLGRALVFSMLMVALGMVVWWMWLAPASLKEGIARPGAAEASPARQTPERVSLRLDQPQQGSASPALERRGLHSSSTATNPPAPSQAAPVSPVLGSAPPPDSRSPSASNAVPATKRAAEANSTVRETEPRPTPDSAANASTSGGGSTPPSSSSARSESPVTRLMTQGDSLLAARNLVEARSAYNRALHDPRATLAEAEMLRRRLSDLNATLVFSPTVTPGDPMVETYTLQSGDKLLRVVAEKNLAIDWRFVQRVNQFSDASRLRQGQKLKLVRGPFHAVVTKSAYRMDVYASAKDAEGNHLYIRSFPVGLGEHNSTPVGRFVVRDASKLINPHWVNPRTGEKFAADDPKNPIGERWIGLEGADQNTEVLAGYGIHGTIEPESIGKDASMGCIRMLPGDVEVLYEILAEHESTVEIRP